MTAFDEALKDCLKNCFDVLTGNLAAESIHPDGKAERQFCSCCETCRKAKAIADKQKEDPCEKPS